MSLIKWRVRKCGIYSVNIDEYYLSVCKPDLEYIWELERRFPDGSRFCKAGIKDSVQKAKNAAVFQMNKHKKSLVS